MTSPSLAFIPTTNPNPDHLRVQVQQHQELRSRGVVERGDVGCRDGAERGFRNGLLDFFIHEGIEFAARKRFDLLFTGGPH